MASTGLTGYGPCKYRVFDGDEEKYELWEAKFLGYMRLRKLLDVITDAGTPDVEKNAEAYAELVQYLDDRSLSLIIRDAKDQGNKALQILRDHYLGRSKPRIIALYTEMTSLKKGRDESITDYVIRAETAATSLKTAGETFSESLLIAMILKGLPPEYKTFSTVVTQKETPQTFTEFKIALRTFEETEKCHKPHSTDDDAVMKSRWKNSDNSQSNFVCFTCGKVGHRKFECPNQGKKENSKNSFKSRTKRWCSYCKSATHDTNFCRKNASKSLNYRNDERQNQGNDDPHSFAFQCIDSKPNEIMNKARPNVDVSAYCLLVDCGATTHIVNDKSKFTRFDENFDPSNHVIELADGSRQKGIVLGKGDASVCIYDVNGIPQDILLKNALYIPSYKQNIFSVQSAVGRGACVDFRPNFTELRATDGTVFDIKKEGKLYFLNNVNEGNSKRRVHTIEEWHKILGHCNVRDVIKLESVVEGMKIIGKSNFDCKTCVMGKMTQFRNREADKRATCQLELVHCDLAGPIDPIAREGFRYVISFVDDFSGLIIVYFLKAKSDAVTATEKFLADIAPYGSVKRLRTDNGTEFSSSSFRTLMTKNLIKHEFSAPYSPHQNGTVERSWRSIFDMARCLLLEANLPKKLWTYAVRASAYIRNRCYSPRTGRTPFELLTGVKPNLCNMHVFGTVCYAYVQNKKKLDARSEEGIFVGYDNQSPAYIVYFPKIDDVKRVRCVKFCEDFYEKPESSPFTTNHECILPCDSTLQPDVINNDSEGTDNCNNDEMNVDEHSESNEDNEQEGAVANKQSSRFPKREINKPKYLEDYVTDSDLSDIANCAVDYCYRVTDVPENYENAISSPKAEQWQKAMDEEMNALVDNDTFKLTPIPEGRSVVGGKWVYTIKVDSNKEEKFKARYVAKGYSQVQNIDYRETFSPTARITSIRMLIQLASQNNWLIHQMDVKTAYLNADIDCEIYVDQPEGYVKTGNNGEKLVWKLKKSLYGLKQSGRNWNNVLHEFLLQENFVQSFADPCLYSKFVNDSRVILIVWVDDIIISTENENILSDVKKALCNKFKMKDLKRLSWFLGIEFSFEKDCITMNQTKYLEKMLDRFGMSDCKPKATPCDLSVNKMIDDSDELSDARLYREIIGSLIYVMTGTRPDLCYVVSKLSQYMAKPSKAHLNLAKHCLRYLKGTLNYSLRFSRSDKLKLIGFCDADWGASEDRFSISGYSFQLSSKGPLISWKSRKQRTVALSSCEAEYVALTDGLQEAKFLRQLFADMTGFDKTCVTVFADNQGAIALSKNPVHHQRSKHIDIKYHFIRSEILNGVIELCYIPSEDNIADIFTKAVSKCRLNKFAVIRGVT